MIDKITEEDKRKSAYALNLCTVSVSQIVDYDDLNILEQEYDAILNNLNLEKIIKDDSLLNVLKQILDTITYFKMEDVERKIIEKEYQQQMNNAIWSSVPNFGLLLAGGSPLTMAISLASQVGIGYMNYRRNKNQYAWEKEKKLMRLQQSAIEQFNGLRRELFSTAWNLAEKYEFPDELRLTEKQIKQYNNILKDPDPIRKFERLSHIKNNFKAYPPFWYFYGSTANYIANAKVSKDFKFDLSPNTREFYKSKAINAFKKYKELEDFNVLRENQITSSWALEYADILLAKDEETKSSNKKEIKSLIDRAKEMSPNAYDVQELCAIAYLKIGDQQEAAKILKFLVNEDYNKVINGQLLSSIYVNRIINEQRNDKKAKRIEDYDVLKTRVGDQYLFPMPETGKFTEKDYDKFVDDQKKVLQQKYSYVIDQLVEKYSIKWNKIHSTFDYTTKYDDSFFGRKAEHERLEAAMKVFEHEDTKATYISRLRNQNTILCMVDILNESVNGLFSLPGLLQKLDKKAEVIKKVEDIVKAKKNEVVNLINKAISGDFNYEDYDNLQGFSFEKLYEKSIPDLQKCCTDYVNSVCLENLSNVEWRLRLICNKENIRDPEIVLEDGSRTEIDIDTDGLPFNSTIFGTEGVKAQIRLDNLKKALDTVNKYLKENGIPRSNDNVHIYVKGDNEFERYFQTPVFNQHPWIMSNAFLIFDDKSSSNLDLIFTPIGIFSVKKDKLREIRTLYNEVLLEGNDTLFVKVNKFFTQKEKFKNSIFAKTICDLAQEFVNYFKN